MITNTHKSQEVIILKQWKEELYPNIHRSRERHWGLMLACDHFIMYIIDTQFLLVTDNKPLLRIFKESNIKPAPRLKRWSLQLQAFNFTLESRL